MTTSNVNSETTFTAASGARCQFEIYSDDDGICVNAVWIWGKPTVADMEELASFLQHEALKAGLLITGAEHHQLGPIQPEDLGRVREIVKERMADEH